MKSKKSAAKLAKKAGKSAAKKPAVKVVAKKKPVVKAKPVTKASKSAAKSKTSAKPVPSRVKAAASKLKSLFSKSKPAPKPVKKTVAVKPAPAKAQVAPSKKPVAVAKPFISKLAAPKGLITEVQIRRMSEKDYMNETQLEFFRHRLLQMREEVLTREVDVKERLHQREVFADPADRATAEEEHWLDLRLRERESLLLRKIDEALRRIAEREFGYCEKTGDSIGIPRLLARPTATVCVDVKGQDERVEAQFRDR